MKIEAMIGNKHVTIIEERSAEYYEAGGDRMVVQETPDIVKGEDGKLYLLVDDIDEFVNEDD